MLTIRKLNELKEIIRWAPLFRAAGLNESTMRSAMYHERELKPEEASAIEKELVERGVCIYPRQQTLEFPD